MATAPTIPASAPLGVPQDVETARSNLGFDLQKIWCTNFTLSVAADHVVLVASEVVHVPVGTDVATLAKNVSGLVMPVNAIKALRDLLNQQFPIEGDEL